MQQLQQPMELATAAAKAQGIKECEATQAELASTMQAASKEVDQLTKSLEVQICSSTNDMYMVDTCAWCVRPTVKRSKYVAVRDCAQFYAKVQFYASC